MNRYRDPLLLAGILFVIAVLAVFAIIPETIAQYAPLVVLPFVLARRGSCRPFGTGQRA